MHIIVHVLVNISQQLRINHSSYSSWLLYMFKFVVFNSCYTCNRHHLHLLIFILVRMFIFIFIIMFIRFTFVLKLICILILALVLIPDMHTYICTLIHAHTLYAYLRLCLYACTSLYTLFLYALILIFKFMCYSLFHSIIRLHYLFFFSNSFTSFINIT